MRRKSKLDFSSERASRAKRTRTFVISFVAFILVFGSVSLLVFMKSLDFDLQNLVKKTEESTSHTEASSTAEPVKAADANILLVCHDANKNISLLALVSANAENAAVTVSALDVSASIQGSFASGESFQSVFEKQGLAGLKNAVASECGIKIDRYIRVSENDLKKAIGTVGDVSITIPQAIQYRDADFNLYLDSGTQSLTGDLFVKYLRYADTTEKSDAACSLVKTVLYAFGESNRDKLFNTLFNLSDTDFSVVDFTDSSGLVNVFLSMRENISVAALPNPKES